MTELTKLSSSQHGDLKVAANCAVEVASSQHIVSILAPELGKAACSFPIFVTRVSGSGDMALSAMTGVKPGASVFVRDGAWDAIYIPTAMQTFPLFLMQSQDDEKGYAVGINENSDVFSKDSGEALFDAAGKPSLYQNHITALLEADIKNSQLTFQFLKTIDELALVKAIQLRVEYNDGEVETLQGLNTIDEDTLQSLSAAKLEELHKTGYLPAIYAMLMSLEQVNNLVRKFNSAATGKKIQQVKIEIARETNTP